MFGWGRKTDGFDWHQHVRTTIKLRREDRRARIAEAGEVAVDGIRYAGRVGVSAGSTGAVSLWNGTLSAIQMIIRFAIAGGQAMARDAKQSINLSNFSWRGTIVAWNTRGRASGLPPVIGAAGLVALHAAFARTSSGAAVSRTEQLVALTIALLCLAAAIAPFARGQMDNKRVLSLLARVPVPAGASVALAKLTPVQRRNVGIGLMAAILLTVGYFVAGSASTGPFASLSSFRPFSTPPLEGRATVLAGDLVRIGTTTVRLSGIEAPDVEQRCGGDAKKTWACGEAARNALTRLVKGKTVRCDLSGTDDAGFAMGSCDAGAGQNLSATLVSEGAVFAAGSFLSSLSTLEADAKAKKAGIWRGEAERPSDYRAKIWDVAAKAAPDGCPIKGLVSGESKSYVLPWSRDYRGAKVRTTRGERFFCSEAEAQAAGWKAAGR